MLTNKSELDVDLRKPSLESSSTHKSASASGEVAQNPPKSISIDADKNPETSRNLFSVRANRTHFTNRDPSRVASDNSPQQPSAVDNSLARSTLV
jgi:hypothetical protein